MDTRFPETFITVADCGSVAGAARRLTRTSAALAQRLRALEQDFGHVLVTRSGRTIQPTAEGPAILGHARVLVEGARDLRALAAQDVPTGQLRLGATATALTGLLPSILMDLGAGYPGLEYFVQPGSSADLYHRVLGGAQRICRQDIGSRCGPVAGSVPAGQAQDPLRSACPGGAFWCGFRFCGCRSSLRRRGIASGMAARSGGCRRSSRQAGAGHAGNDGKGT